MNDPRTAAGQTPPGALRACLVVVALLGTVGLAGCGTAAAPTHEQMAPAPAPMEEAAAGAWAARPAYTNVSSRTAEAYAYALEHRSLVSYLPCYCGCGAMGHGSNLDCYFEPRGDGEVVFEEHASYCDICVDITLRAKQLAATGTSLINIRSAIDAEFGNAGPGTDTELPAS